MGWVIVEAYALAGVLGLIAGVAIGIWISFRKTHWLVWLGILDDV